MATKKKKGISCEQAVKGDRARAWGGLIHGLMTRCPQVIQTLMRNPERLEFVKVWWRYGHQAQGPERKWAQKYGKGAGLSVDGIVALEALSQGLAGTSWLEFEAAVLLECSLEPAEGTELSASAVARAAKNGTLPRLLESVVECQDHELAKSHFLVVS